MEGNSKRGGGGGGLQPLVENADLGSEIVEKVVTFLSWVLIVVTFPLSIFICYKVVQQYERAVIFSFGRLKSGDSRGIFFIVPCTDYYTKVDTRSSVFDIPPQEVITKDSVTVTVDAVLFYRVCDAVKAVTKVANAQSSTKLLAQTTLRGILGQRNLGELLAERDAIGSAMAIALDEVTTAWGIKVEKVEMTDVRLPNNLQRAMGAEGEANREAKAKVIAAEGEHKASRALKEASDILTESPAALQLRYLQTLTTIATENNRTIIFPLPFTLINRLVYGNLEDEEGNESE